MKDQALDSDLQNAVCMQHKHEVLHLSSKGLSLKIYAGNLETEFSDPCFSLSTRQLWPVMNLDFMTNASLPQDE